jgi:hypothetical protein
VYNHWDKDRDFFMGGKTWALKAVEEVVSPRHSKKKEKGWLNQKRRATLHRDGKWFSHGLSDYQMWWEFLVRAEQAHDIQVDWKRYKDWGNPADYQNINVWDWKSRKDGFWKFWKAYGIGLFAENDDKVVQVHLEGENIKVGKDKFCLEIPTGTKSDNLMKIIDRLVEENTDATKSSHISTATEPIVKFEKGGKLVRAEIRTDAFRRWLKMWDMKHGGYSTDEIDSIHGKGGKNHKDFDEYKTTYRNLWKAKKVVGNVARGAFPGSIT